MKTRYDKYKDKILKLCTECYFSPSIIGYLLLSSRDRKNSALSAIISPICMRLCREKLMKRNKHGWYKTTVKGENK